MSFEIPSDENRRFEPFPDPRGEKPSTQEKRESAVKVRDPREFIIGDNHFYDSNIINYCRDFASVLEMNEYMVENWNSVVENNDTIFVLGDFFDFSNCTETQAIEILNRLNGRKILIVGNHDKGYEEFYRSNGVEVIDYTIVKDGFWFLSHEPMFVTEAAPYANIFAHVHTNPMYRTVSSRSFCASAERHDYTPVPLSEAKRMVVEYKE